MDTATAASTSASPVRKLTGRIGSVCFMVMRKSFALATRKNIIYLDIRSVERWTVNGLGLVSMINFVQPSRTTYFDLARV